MEATQTRESAIKTALSQSYDIRFNAATGKLEIKEKDSQEPYSVVTNDGIKSLIALLRDNGIDARKPDIYKVFNTQFRQEKDTELQLIEMYLDTVLEKRFNCIKMQPEIRRDGGDWQQLTKYDVNSLVRELDANGIKASGEKLNNVFFSDFCEKVNPVKDYFLNLTEYDAAKERDWIKALADTVTMEIGQDRWLPYLTKWLVGCVSNVFCDERCTNQVMLVITGKQGAYKTTWLENLCPKDLKRYMYSGKIDPTNKDIETLMAENFLLNIDDQLHILNKKDSEDLKNLITKSIIKYRRPYDVFIQEYPHLASFCGSVNGNEFLNDPTGSRRFLPFEAASIDIDAAKAIDINNVWRQAYSLFRQGFVYWFNHDEVAEITEQNADFAMISLEEQFIMKCFEPAESSYHGAVAMQSGEILSYIQNVSGIKNLSMKRVGSALAKLGYTKKRQLTRNVYYVLKKDIEQ